MNDPTRPSRLNAFGPVLPIIPYDTLNEAIRFINAGTRPLALYCFSHDDAERQHLLRLTHSGGVTLNDWGWPMRHLAVLAIPAWARITARKVSASCRTPRPCSSDIASSPLSGSPTLWESCATSNIEILSG